jgi:hypothetical protein
VISAESSVELRFYQVRNPDAGWWSRRATTISPDLLHKRILPLVDPSRKAGRQLVSQSGTTWCLLKQLTDASAAPVSGMFASLPATGERV